MGSEGSGHPGSDGGLTMTDGWMTVGSVCWPRETEASIHPSLALHR